MALVRWEPARELASLQQEVNRLFGTFFDAPGGGAADQGARVVRRWIPAMDLVETQDAFVLKADLPGLAEDDVSIEVEDGVLTVSGERAAQHEQEPEGYVRVEREFGAFRRSLTLPVGVDPARVTARFDKGVLEVRIPRPEDRKPRKVAIRVGDAPAAIEGEETDAGARGDGEASRPAASSGAANGTAA